MVPRTMNLLCSCRYGFRFLQEAFLYHLTRQDHRHNFSPYFYYFYLAGGSATRDTLGPSSGALFSPAQMSLLAFAPQLLLLLYIGARFARDLPFACFLMTFIFVSFNKVITSQYFLWYIVWLPFISPERLRRLSPRKAAFLGLLWIAAQVGKDGRAAPSPESPYLPLARHSGCNLHTDWKCWGRTRSWPSSWPAWVFSS
jgi:phosphatidylinositol glycan class M